MAQRCFSMAQVARSDAKETIPYNTNYAGFTNCPIFTNCKASDTHTHRHTHRHTYTHTHTHIHIYTHARTHARMHNISFQRPAFLIVDHNHHLCHLNITVIIMRRRSQSPAVIITVNIIKGVETFQNHRHTFQIDL